ncbi:hypothetical protein SRHO_G00063480 [Serrasalmus rhombeus]
MLQILRTPNECTISQSYSGHTAVQGPEIGKNLTGSFPREKDRTVRVTLLSSWPDGTDPSDVHTVMKQAMRFTALHSAIGSENCGTGPHASEEERVSITGSPIYGFGKDLQECGSGECTARKWRTTVWKSFF